MCPSPPIRYPHEKNVPALSKASCPSIWFSSPHAHQGRSRHPGASPGEGTCPSRRCPDRTQVRPPHAGLGRLAGLTAQLPSGADSPASQVLPRARIIRRRRVFDATRLKGKRVANRYMALNFLPHDPAKPDQASVAFLTPKRLGGAVKRNQLRRRMREIYRRCLAQPTENSYLVWVARPPALELDFEGIKKVMTELRQRMKVS